jgi:hypothetical protein
VNNPRESEPLLSDSRPEPKPKRAPWYKRFASIFRAKNLVDMGGVLDPTALYIMLAFCLAVSVWPGRDALLNSSASTQKAGRGRNMTDCLAGSITADLGLLQITNLLQIVVELLPKPREPSRNGLSQNRLESSLDVVPILCSGLTSRIPQQFRSGLLHPAFCSSV